MRIYRTFSSQETKKLGYKIAKGLLAREARSAKLGRAVVLALSGELGSGKTTFVQGFLPGLGIKRRSASPTFIIFRKFMVPASAKASASGKPSADKSAGKHSSWFRSAYHVDAYRIKKPRELSVLGFKEILSNPRNIVLVEWAERAKKTLPKDSIWLKFRYAGSASERKISVGGKRTTAALRRR